MDPHLGRSSLDPPADLGRNLVVRPGAEVPQAWSSAPRLVLTADLVDDERAGALATALAGAAIDRRSLVIECPDTVDLVLDPDRRPDGDRSSSVGSDIAPVAVWDLARRRGWAGPGLEELHHRVWSNAIDLRRPDRPRWSIVERALAAGARPTSGCGDVVSGGRPVWIDAGPLRRMPPIDGVEVLPALVVTAGRSRVGSPVDVAPATSAPDQHAVVTSPVGSIEIIAPAGSGKTRVLTDRVRHLIDHWGVPPGVITVVAFNRRARQKLASRLVDHPTVRVVTLNALGLSILGSDPARRPRRTLPAAGFARLVSDLCGDHPVDDERLTVVLDRVRRARLGLEPPGDLDPTLTRLLRRIDAALERSGRIDFDGQIDAAVKLLLGDQQIRHRHQDLCRVLVVDEFQDLAPAHLLLVTLLAGRGGAVVAVGDDDQTIYGYQGAHPSSLTEIERFVPGIARYRLEVNYRCPPEVVAAVGELLGHNSVRLPKKIRPAHGRSPTGAIEIHRVDDPLGCTVDLVEEALGGGVLPSEIAVLTRVNARLAPVAAVLAQRSIPVGRLDRRCRPDIGEIVLEWLRWTEGDSEACGPSPPGSRTPDADIEHLRGLLAVGAPLGRWFEALMIDVAPDGLGIDTDATQAVAEAIAHLDRCRPRTGRWHRWLSGLIDAPVPVDPTGITLSTVHRVKGLEWPMVIMHAADDLQYPHRLSTDLEAERRIFHVGITRARHRLVIISGRRPSPFVAELGRGAVGRSRATGTVAR